MKKFISFLLMLSLLTASATAMAADKSFPIVINIPDDVYSVYASYTPSQENIESITVEFDPTISSYAYANYSGGKLWISIASAEAIDLSAPLARVTATLTDGNTVAPHLVISSLRVNGKDAVSGFAPIYLTAGMTEDTVTVSATLLDGYMKSYPMTVAIYSSNGTISAVQHTNAVMTQNTQEFTAVFNNCSNGSYVKVFFMESNLRPLSRHMECTVNKN